MKRLSIILGILFLFLISANAQFVNTQTVASATTDYKSRGGLTADSLVHLAPIIFADTTAANFSVVSKYSGAIIQVSPNQIWYRSLLPNQWHLISSSSGGGFLPVSDTSAMLAPYLRKSDTANMLLPYLRKTDTALMLSHYLLLSDTANLVAPYLRTSDTAFMLSAYYNKTASDARFVQLTRLINTNAPLYGGGALSSDLTLGADTGRANAQLVSGGSLNQVKDSLVALISASGGGTVLSVSTTDGVGIISSVSDPTANPNISIKADTLILSTRLHVDSVAMRKLNISDTTSMLNNYLRITDTLTMLNPYLRKTDTLNMLNPYLRKTDTLTMLNPYLRKSDTAYMLSNRLKISDTTIMLSGYTRVQRFLDTTSTLRSLINTKGTGTVTSVGLSAPSFLTVTNSPVTTTGTLTLTLANQTANTVFAGATTGSPAQPTFRALVAADLPDSYLPISDTSAMLSGNYLRLNTSNNPLTGNLNITKAFPVINLLSNTGNSGAAINLLGWQTINKNWQIGTANISGNSINFTPSTIIGDSTFENPAATINENGLFTSSNLTLSSLISGVAGTDSLLTTANNGSTRRISGSYYQIAGNYINNQTGSTLAIQTGAKAWVDSMKSTAFTLYDSANHTTFLTVNNPYNGSSARAGLFVTGSDPEAGQYANYGQFTIYPYNYSGDDINTALAGNLFIQSGGGSRGIINFFDGVGAWQVSTKKPLGSSGLTYFSNDIYVPHASYTYSTSSPGIGFGTWKPNILMSLDSVSQGYTFQGASTIRHEAVDTGSVVDNTLIYENIGYGAHNASNQLAKFSYYAKGSLKNSGQFNLGTFKNGTYGDGIIIDSNHYVSMPFLPNGTAGTDSIKVTSGGIEKRIAANTYTPASGNLTNRRIPFVNSLGQLKDTTGFTWQAGNLNIPGSGAFSSAAGTVTNTSSTGTNQVYYRATNTGGSATFGRESSTGGAILTGAPAYSTVLTGGGNTYPLVFGVNDAVALTIVNGGAATFASSITASSLIKSGGTSSQFLMADGSTTSTNTNILNQTSAQSNANFSLSGTSTGSISNASNIGASGINSFVSINTPTDVGTSLTSGSVVSGSYGELDYTSTSSRTIGSSNVNGAGVFLAKPTISGSSTITMTQGGGGVRAMSALTGIFYQPNSAASSSTITHAAGLRSFLYADNTSNTYTITNYYGVLVGSSTEFSPSNITNRYGIYQEGVSDQNLLNGATTLGNLAGTGSRAVLADANGLLSAPVSDSSVKENIKNLSFSIKDFMKLRPVSFTYKKGWQNYGKGNQIGFIAQEVKEVMPNSTFTTPSTGKMGYNEIDMIPILVKMVQEQQKQIDNLKSEIKKLKK